MKKLMIYGASGYTGRMAAAHARRAGLDLVLAGRDAADLAQLATDLGAECRVFALDGGEQTGAAFDGVAVLLNCAGPFHRTAGPLMRACVARGVHYLDIAAELDSYHLAEALDTQAQAAGVLLLPGSGGSVAMLGCLVRHVTERVPAPAAIRVALHVSGSMSRGSALSASENMRGCLERVGGQLVPSNPETLGSFDFGSGAVPCFPVTLPDLVTLWKDTRAANIATYVHVSGSAFPQGELATLPAGPTREERVRHRYQAAVDVTGADGRSHRALLDTVNGYTFTPVAAIHAARRVLAGELRPGFQTPAGLFGAAFALDVAGTTMTDLPA